MLDVPAVGMPHLQAGVEQKKMYLGTVVGVSQNRTLYTAWGPLVAEYHSVSVGTFPTPVFYGAPFSFPRLVSFS